MNAEHTPGPWRATTDGSDEVYSEAEYQSICMVLGTNYAEANARLIAAAPELLEALKMALDAHDYEGREGWVVNARAAIEKTEGR